MARPSEQLAALMAGDVRWDDTPAPIQSWAGFAIYRHACAVLALPDKEARREALGKLPPDIQARVEAEALRLWKLRKPEN